MGRMSQSGPVKRRAILACQKRQASRRGTTTCPTEAGSVTRSQNYGATRSLLHDARSYLQRFCRAQVWRALGILELFALHCYWRDCDRCGQRLRWPLGSINTGAQSMPVKCSHVVLACATDAQDLGRMRMGAAERRRRGDGKAALMVQEHRRHGRSELSRSATP